MKWTFLSGEGAEEVKESTETSVQEGQEAKTTKETAVEKDLELAKTLVVNGICSYSSYVFDEPAETTLCIKVQAPEREEMNDTESEEKKPPLDIVVVLDRSGSMMGTPLNLCKKSMEFFAEQLRPKDRLGIVTYGTNVDVTLPLQSMDEGGKLAAKAAIDGIRVEGMTNLSGGLFEGMDQIMKEANREDTKTHKKVLLLLTDGFANRGVVGTEQLVKMVKDRMEEMDNDLKMYTFGYGTRHRGELLEQIAEIGNGGYFFIKDVDNVPFAFAECLGGLTSVVAQTINVDIKPGKGVELVGEPLTSYASNKMDDIDQKWMRVTIPDIQEGETKNILVKIKLPSILEPQLEGSVENLNPFATVSTSYIDVEQSKKQTTETALRVNRPEKLSEEARKESFNAEVLVQELRVEAVESMKLASKEANCHELETARKRIHAIQVKILEAQRDYEYIKHNSIMVSLLAQLAEIEKGMESRHRWEADGEKVIKTANYGFSQERGGSAFGTRRVSGKHSTMRRFLNKQQGDASSAQPLMETNGKAAKGVVPTLMETLPLTQAQGREKPSTFWN